MMFGANLAAVKDLFCEGQRGFVFKDSRHKADDKLHRKGGKSLRRGFTSGF